jgi:hypothetical protein
MGKSKKSKTNKNNKTNKNENSKKTFVKMFETKPIKNTSKVKTKMIGKVEYGLKPNEEFLTSYNLGEIDGHEITGSVYTCRYPGEYLRDFKKIPVLNFIINYSYSHVFGTIGSITLMFDIDNEDRGRVITNYINREMYGKYYLEFNASSNELYNVFKDKIKEINNSFSEIEKFEKYDKIFEDYIKPVMNTEIYKNTINEIINDVKELRKDMMGMRNDNSSDIEKFMNENNNKKPINLEEMSEDDVDKLV